MQYPPVKVTFPYSLTQGKNETLKACFLFKHPMLMSKMPPAAAVSQPALTVRTSKAYGGSFSPDQDGSSVLGRSWWVDMTLPGRRVCPEGRERLQFQGVLEPWS